MSGIIFDLDGTLIDSAPDIHAAMNAVLADRDAGPLPLEQVRGFIGNGVAKLVERCIRAAGLEATDTRLAVIAAAFHARYDSDVQLTSLYPYV